MTVSLEDFSALDKRIPMPELIARLQETLRRNHLKILEAARREWENRPAGDDPSDACATIRVAKSSRQVKPRPLRRKLAARRKSSR